MPLDTPRRFGPYETVAFLGAGGMGEVYEAVDTRLNRRVALKVLPPHLVADDERRKRFVQEAQLASSLQHPNIVTIYDIGSANSTDYLAMELVRGRTLDSVIPAKGLRLPDALRYAIQITDALAAAHAAGIVHRDLKPGNIMVTDQDQVKILDFGLATLVNHGVTSSIDDTRMPSVETGAGTILGSVAYMSPEQAEGKKVDARSDIFSFGAIMYEMLSGQRAFRADSTPATLAAVINLEPRPLTNLTDVPQPVERLVSRCLRKDLARRAQHASDIKVTLEELREDSSSGILATPSPVQRSRRWLVPVVSAAVIVLALVSLAALWPRTPPPPTSFEPVPLTSLPGSEQAATISPDGTQVAFSWVPATVGTRDPGVYVQLINGTGARRRLVDDGRFRDRPSWSPDGTLIALWRSDGQNDVSLNLISPLGGSERQLLAWDGATQTPSWSPDGRWLAVSPVSTRENLDKGIVLISPTTGERVDWAPIDRAFVSSTQPAFSPDGRRLAYTRITGDFTGLVSIVSVGNDGRPVGQPSNLDYKGQGLRNPVWTADGRNILVIDGSETSNGGVTRIPIDAPDKAQRLTGLDHATTLTLSRDGSKLVFSRGNANDDLWRIDLKEPAKSGPIAQSTLHESGAEYSPDGKRIAFSSNRGGGREIWVADADGNNATAITHFNGPIAGTPRWSPDNNQIVFDSRPDGNSDIFVVSASGGPVRQVTRTPGEDARPAWSPDGKVIYFSSDRSGRNEIWRMSPTGGEPVQITHNGGFVVMPSSDGQHLFYKRLPGSEPIYGIYDIHPDGTGDTVIVPETTFAVLPYTATARGIWWLSAPIDGRDYWSIRMLGFADRKIVEVVKLDSYPGPLNLSVSPDERYVLLTRADRSGTDLLLVNNFR